jgi:hypothetical protein
MTSPACSEQPSDHARCRSAPRTVWQVPLFLFVNLSRKLCEVLLWDSRRRE